MKVIVLSKKSYDFENGDGERVQGAKLSYILPSATITNEIHGNPPIQVALSSNVTIDRLPGVYDLDFDFVPGKNNKPEMQLKSLAFLKDVDFAKCL